MGYIGIFTVGLATIAVVAGSPQVFNFQMGDPDFAEVGPSSGSTYRGSGSGRPSGGSPSYLRGSALSSSPSSSSSSGGLPSYVIRESGDSGGRGEGSPFSSRPSYSSGRQPFPQYESDGEDGSPEGPSSYYGSGPSGGSIEESEGPSDDESFNYIPSGRPSGSYQSSAQKPSYSSGGPPTSFLYESSPAGPGSAGGRPSYSSASGPPPPQGFGGFSGRYPGGPRGPPSSSPSFPMRLGRSLMGLLSSAGTPHFSVTPQYYSTPSARSQLMEGSASTQTSFYLQPPTKDAPFHYGARSHPKSPPPPFRGSRSSSPLPLLTSATTNQLPQDYFGLSSFASSSGNSAGQPSQTVQQIIAQAAQAQHARVIQKEQRANPTGRITSGGIRLVSSPSGPSLSSGRPQSSPSQYLGQTDVNPFASPVLRQESSSTSAEAGQQQEQQQLIRATGPDGSPVYYQIQGANSAQNIFSPQPQQYSTIAAISQVQPQAKPLPESQQPQQQVYQTINQNQPQTIQYVQPSNFPQGSSGLVSLITNQQQQPATYSNPAQPQQIQPQQSQPQLANYQPIQYIPQQTSAVGPSGGSASTASGSINAQTQYTVQQQPQGLPDLSQFSLTDQSSLYQQLLQSPQSQGSQLQQQPQFQFVQQAQDTQQQQQQQLQQLAQQYSSIPASPESQQQQQLILNQIGQAQQQQQAGLRQPQASQQYQIQPAIQATLSEQQRYQIEGKPSAGLSSSGNTVEYLQQDPVFAYNTNESSGNQQLQQQQSLSQSQQQPQPQQQYSVVSATKQ